MMVAVALGRLPDHQLWNELRAYKVRVATPERVATLALHLRENDGDAKSQYNCGYWYKAGSAEHANHAAARRKAQR